MKFPGRQIVRVLALAGLAIAFAILFGLLVLSAPGMGPVTEFLFALDGHPRVPGFAVGLTVALILLPLATGLFLTWRHWRRCWRWICGTFALVIFVLSLLILVQPAMVGIVDAIIGTRIHDFRSPEVAAGMIAVLLAMTPIALLLVAWRMRRCPWGWIGAGYLLVVPVFAYLAVDEPALSRTVMIEKIAPAFPGDESSFAVLMRYGQQHPLNQNLKVPVQLSHFPDFTQTADTKMWLATNRDKITTNWAALAPVRAWWAELNAFSRIGDLTPLRPDAELLGFHTLREFSQQSSIVAGLQAIDGQGDAAMDTLLTVVEVANKLESSGRTLMRLNLARLIRRHALDAAGFVLDTTPVSPTARARFATALTGGDGGEAGVRRMFDLEYAWQLGGIFNRPLGDLLTVYAPAQSWWRRPLNLVGSLFYNPHRTANRQGEIMAGLQDLAGHRQLEPISAFEEAFPSQQGRPGFKNMMGSLLLLEAHPGWSTIVVRSYWKEEDQRTALLARLAKP